MRMMGSLTAEGAMAKKKARDKPLQGAAWLKRHLERLDNAGPHLENRVLAGIGAWVDDYLGPSSWNPGYGDAIKAAARDNLFETSSEDRARALSRFWGLFEPAARWVGAEGRRDELTQTARDGNSEKHERLCDAVRQVLDEHPRRIGPKSLRHAILKKLDKAEDTPAHEWPTERTIKAVLGDVRRERGIPPRQRAS
jgi:hypothetical protein